MSAAAHYEVFMSRTVPLRRQRWYWRLVAANGVITAVSGEAFSSKDNAVRGANDAQRVAAEAKDVRLVEGPS